MEDRESKVQSLDEYLGERGLSFPVSDFMLDKTRIPHGLTSRAEKRMHREADIASILSHAEDIGVEISKEDAEILAESYACDGEYDCNLSYWNNIENLMEDYIKPEEDITE